MTSFENIQIKISPRERIFEHKRTPSSVNDLNSLPKCFYHNEDDILFFCKHRNSDLILSSLYVAFMPEMFEYASCGAFESQRDPNVERDIF